MKDSWGDGWNGGYLTLYIDGIEEGRFMAKTFQTTDTLYIPDGSSFYLTYTAGTYENENSYTLKDPNGTTVLTDGPNPTTGTVYSATSSCSFTNPIYGTVTVQRYIDAGATNWRFLTTPVQGTVLEDWDDDFVTSGIPGTDFPNWPSATNPWPSMYFYDETVPGPQNNGFYPPASTSDPVTPGTGVWVWCGDTITGTQPFTIDVTGAPNVGPINLPVSYTYSGDPDDGWNMVGNPYPCEIDWDSPNWTKINLNNAIYIWNPDLQQFSSYVAGIGTNGGSRYIATSQAFWVQANAPSPQLTANEFVKTTNGASFIRQNTSNIAQILIAGNNGSDEANIRIDNQNATINFDANIDAQKMYSSSNVPSVATVLSNIDYSINSIPFTQSITIPIRVLSPTAGFYTLTFNNMAAFENATCITLLDKFTGQTQNLKNSNTYTFYLSDTTTVTRFELQVGAPVNYAINAPLCQNSFDGDISINTGYIGSATYNLYDSENNLINTVNDSVGSVQFNNISEGTYILTVSEVGCGSFSDTLVIYGSNSVYAKFELTNDTLNINELITLNNISQNASSYIWNFGDGNQSTDVNPVYSYTNTGNYTITLTAQNLNCNDNYSQNIVVKENTTTSIKSENINNSITAYFKDNNLLIKDLTGDFSEVYITDVSGKEVYRSKLNTSLIIKSSAWSKGTYLLHFSNKNGNKITKKIIKQ
jgi:PKD repeat protein